jgi:antitoxin ParD1/3/4
MSKFAIPCYDRREDRMRGEPAMNVSLTPELERYIADKVGSGLYSTASEVVREALRLLKATDAVPPQRTNDLKGDIERGWQQRHQGPAIAAETVLDDLRQRTGERRAAARKSSS